MDKECLSQRREEKMSVNGVDKKQDDKEDNTKKIEPKSACIFSSEEIKATVKNFILGWLSGVVKIHFRLATEIMTEAKFTKEKKNWDQALYEEQDLKLKFLQVVDICVGVAKATPEQQEKAIEELFSMILVLRAGDRIEGSFMGYNDVNERLRQIEEELAATKDLVFELSMAVKQWKSK
jgi:hypothetical protein